MKKIILIAIISLVVISCKKDVNIAQINKENSNKENVINSKENQKFKFEISFNYEDKQYKLFGNDLNGIMNYYGYNKSSEEHNELPYLGTVSFDYSSIENPIIDSISKNSITTFVGLKKFIIKDIKETNNSYSFNLTGPNKRIVNFFIKVNGENIESLSLLFNKGDVLDAETKSWAKYSIIVAFASAGFIDAYCDQTIANCVAICSSYGVCSQVRSCDAICVACH